MIIADRLSKTNRAELLLYMWQVEDIIRACGCDIDTLRKNYLHQFDVEPAVRKELEQWYENLCDMMRTEGVKEKGHLQICKNILQDLQELHGKLLQSPKFPYYKQMYYKVLPHIVGLRAKQNDSDADELETCFNALYGIMLLRLQKREVSPETAQAAGDISTMLGQLSDYYLKDKEEPIDF